MRAVIGQFAAAVVVLYRRPGSQSVPQKFFDELAAILDRVATHQEVIYIVGDFNIRLDRTDGTYADQLRLLVDCYGLVLHDTEPTHQLGGTLDAVITHDVTGRPDRIAVEDVGLSDHFLLRWEVNMTKYAPSATPVYCRPWCKLDLESFRSALSSSRLCQPTDWPTDVDELATLYDDELNHILDRLIPVRRLDRRQRHSDPWFDNECRAAKRLTRQYERTFAAASRRAASSTTVTPTVAAAARYGCRSQSSVVQSETLVPSTTSP